VENQQHRVSEAGNVELYEQEMFYEVNGKDFPVELSKVV